MRIARVAGIPIDLHWSFLLLSVVWLGSTALATGPAAAVAGALPVVALFVSVVLHELGHALAARGFGLQTDGITLYPFGGVARIRADGLTPTSEFVVALAGPAVNGVLAVAAGALWLVFPHPSVLIFAALNIGMGVFNLTPAFPMDGGRVLRALLAGALGYVDGSRIAFTVGQVLGVGFVIVGLGLGAWSLAMVGAFVFLAAGAERNRLASALGPQRSSAGRRALGPGGTLDGGPAGPIHWRLAGR